MTARRDIGASEEPIEPHRFGIDPGRDVRVVPPAPVSLEAGDIQVQRHDVASVASAATVRPFIDRPPAGDTRGNPVDASPAGAAPNARSPGQRRRIGCRRVDTRSPLRFSRLRSAKVPSPYSLAITLATVSLGRRGIDGANPRRRLERQVLRRTARPETARGARASGLPPPGAGGHRATPITPPPASTAVRRAPWPIRLRHSPGPSAGRRNSRHRPACRNGRGRTG